MYSIGNNDYSYVPFVLHSESRNEEIRKKYLKEMYDDGRQVSESDIAYVVGAALSEVDGILGLKGNVGDVFKECHNYSRGIKVQLGKGVNVSIGARIVIDAKADAAEVISNASRAAALAVKNGMGLTPEKIEMEIAEVTTEKEFAEKCPPLKKVEETEELPETQ